MNVCNARWRLRVPLHGRGASRGREARVRMCTRMRILPYTSTAHSCTHTLALVGTEPGIYVVHWGPCSLAYVGQQSHTRYYSCVTNACIRPTAAATAACTCTHRDGKCSQCTNLRSLLERPPAILLCIPCVCVYVCASVHRAQSHASSRYLGQAFSRFSRFTSILVVFASLNATLSS